MKTRLTEVTVMEYPRDVIASAAVRAWLHTLESFCNWEFGVPTTDRDEIPLTELIIRRRARERTARHAS